MPNLFYVTLGAVILLRVTIIYVSSCVKISFFHAKAHLVFYWCSYSYNSFMFLLGPES